MKKDCKKFGGYLEKTYLWRVKQIDIEIMNRLESTKAINKLKLRAIKNGGYAKYAKKIIGACATHLEAYGMDLTPQQLIK